MIDFNAAEPQLQPIDADEWARRIERLQGELRNRTREIVGTIFPLARMHGSDARIGSIDGGRGESLSIGLDGDRAGLWTDHATGEGGDLITLWQQTAGSREFPDAVKELEEWLGLGPSRPRFATRVQKVADDRKAKADKLPKAEPESLGIPVATYHYLAADAVTVLGIIRRYESGEVDPATGKRAKTFRPQRPDGRGAMPDVRPLYHLPQIATASEVVLVEGEKCADALDSLGITATTQMGGANADPQKTDWSPLAGKSVAVWQDNDQAGSGLTERVRASLEAIGCKVRPVKIPAGKPKGWDAADAVAEGMDVQSVLAVEIGATGKRKMRFLTLAELMNMKPPEWLVDGMVPAGGFVSLYGPHGSMKSFVALDWALCAVHGTPWLGQHAVKRGHVVYVAGEGQSGIGQRIYGWAHSRGVSDDPRGLHVLPQSVAMPTAEVDELLGIIAELPEKPVMIVLDTLARTFGAGDENSQKDMNAFIRGCDKLREETGACVLVIHHTGKDAERGTRGSTALPGAVDTNIYVRRKDMGLTLVNKAPHGKQKDAEEFADVTLRAAPVRFIHQGTEHKTLVMMLDDAVKIDADGDVDGADRVRRVKLGHNQKVVIELLQKASLQGRGLGFVSLATATGIDQGTLGKTLTSLVEREMATVSEGEPRLWMFLDCLGGK